VKGWKRHPNGVYTRVCRFCTHIRTENQCNMCRRFCCPKDIKNARQNLCPICVKKVESAELPPVVAVA
jgi:hypothetical protein